VHGHIHEGGKTGILCEDGSQHGAVFVLRTCSTIIIVPLPFLPL
jgi:hypothetical protein